MTPDPGLAFLETSPGMEILEGACLKGFSAGGCRASDAQGSLDSPSAPKFPASSGTGALFPFFG